MGQPVTVNIPHKLGLAEARSRIGAGVHTLGESVPGATVTDHHWEEDTMHCTLAVMGQRIGGEMQVREDEVYAIFDLPPLLAMLRQQAEGKASERSTEDAGIGHICSH